MKTAIVCIAKNEDEYIEEWIDYHLKIGFTDIFIYQNDWIYLGKHTYDKRCHFFELNGECQQLNAYNDFLENHSKLFDWALFIDIDEFLYPSGFLTVENLFKNYTDNFAVGFNWKLFGSNGLKKVEYRNYEVTTRFTKSQEGFNQHIKTAINLKKCRDNYIMNDVKFINPHFVGIAARTYFTVNSDKTTYIHGPWYKDSLKTDVPYIAHYFTKSEEEFKLRRSYGRADTPLNMKQYYRTMKDFEEHDRNDVENLDIALIQHDPFCK